MCDTSRTCKSEAGRRPCCHAGFSAVRPKQGGTAGARALVPFWGRGLFHIYEEERASFGFRGVDSFAFLHRGETHDHGNTVCA